MSSSYICLPCRRRLANIRPANLQWQSKATFISLRGKAPTSKEAPPQESRHTAEPPKPGHDGDIRRGPYGSSLSEKNKISSLRRDLSKWDELEAFWKRGLNPDPGPPPNDKPGMLREEAKLGRSLSRTDTTGQSGLQTRNWGKQEEVPPESRNLEPHPSREPQYPRNQGNSWERGSRTFANTSGGGSIRRVGATSDALESPSDHSRNPTPVATLKGTGRNEEPRRKSLGRIMVDKRKSHSRRNTMDNLESLFEQSVNAGSEGAVHRPISSSTLEPYTHAETLKKMFDDSYPLGDCWKYFVEHFATDDRLKHQSTRHRSLPHYIHAISGNLFRKILHAKRRKPSASFFPTVTELSAVYLKLRTLHGQEWTEMVYILLENISEIKKQPLGDSEKEKMLVLDLLGAWNVVARQAEDIPKLSTIDIRHLHWSARTINPVSSKNAQQYFNKRGPQQMFGLITPHFTSGSLTDVPLVALATFSLLSGSNMSRRPEVFRARILVDLLGRLAGVPGLSFDQVNTRPVDDPVATFVKESWAQLRLRAAEKSSSDLEAQMRAEQREYMEAGMSTTKPRSLVSFINQRLHAAWKQQNLNQVEDLWSDVSLWPVYTMERDKNKTTAGQLSMELCNYFILIFMALRQPNRSIDVWNHAVQNGLTPSIATWDAMLSGCKASNDVKALEELWYKMVESGVQPDVVCWTTRISAFAKTGHSDKAIQVLDEMGRLWLEAAKLKHRKMKPEELKLATDVEGAAKPTIANINAVIHGLLWERFKVAGQDKKATAAQVLTWGAQFGIKPNIITYNTFLRPLMKDGKIKEAVKLIREMHSSGLQADVVTFTTLLDELLPDAEEHTAEQHRKVVEIIFAEMKNAGVTPNLHTYGRMIHQLLRSSTAPDENLRAANELIEHMSTKHGLQPTIHIYSTLLDFHFSRKPPNLDAARNIIERASAVAGLGTDRVFWNKAVECYAQLGETGAALRIVGKLAKEKARVGWGPLAMLLEALAENQDWNMAKSLVRDAVLDRDEKLLDYMEPTGAEQRFFQLAVDLKLIEENVLDPFR